MSYDKDIIKVGWRDDNVRWTAHWRATHIPTGLEVRWVASWNDCGWPEMRALAKLDDMIREELARREPKS